ncbi:MAG: type III pantothenate kinase [Clostridia bacterium]|nr:type III pantothenate kinase [Clostridia bacterium]
MIICIDIGNTNIKYAVYDGNDLRVSFRVSTDFKRTSDEYGEQIIGMLDIKGISANEITGGIVSSVVPSLDYTIDKMCEIYLNIKPLHIAPGLRSGLNIRCDDAREVGADRIVNCVSAIVGYGENKPMIVVDFGTAKLPRVEIEAPKSIIAKNTVTNMQAGIVFGFAGLVEYIVKRIKKELKTSDVKTLATGGFRTEISKEVGCIDVVDKLLTLKGLKYLYDLNTEQETLA